MNLDNLVIAEIKKAFKSLYDLEEEKIALQATRKDFEGTHTVVTFPYTKKLGRKPEEIGEAIGAFLLNETDIITKYNVAKGFLNLSVDDKLWVSVFKEIAQHQNWGQLSPKNKKVMVEYSSPNTNKPLHLGHLRTNFLGFSVAKILEAAGYDVIKANLVNDRGIHICKSMLMYQKYGSNETPESSGIKGDHLIGKYYVMFDQYYKVEIQKLLEEGIDKKEAEKKAPLMIEAQAMLKAWEEGEQEVYALWEKMNGWVYNGFDKTYHTIGVAFDKVYYESNTYLLGKKIVDEGLEKSIFFTKEDGSVWIDLSEEKLEEKLLLRGDGTSVYMTQDMGTADLKYEDFKIDKSIYVVGNEQDYHFKVLFTILKKLKRTYADGLYHLSYGMVELPKGQGKIKSREGTRVDADDLVEEMTAITRTQTEEKDSQNIEYLSKEEREELYHLLAIAALKFFLLIVDAKKKMVFDPQKSISTQGDTGVFIQYTYVRTASILRAASKNTSINEQVFQISSLEDSERKLIELLKNYPDKIEEAGEKYEPSILAQYVLEIAKSFNHFYHECSVLKAESADLVNFRVSLTRKVGQMIKHGLSLLGIDVPERM